MANKNININVGANISDFTTKMQAVEKALVKTGKSMQSAGKSMSTYITAPLVALGGVSLKAAADMETLETSLSVMLGSAKEGKKLLSDLADFTAKTPFEIESVGNAAKQLLAFGFNATQVKENLQFLGDVAAGSGNQIGELAQIFGQVSAAGKLTGERFNQLQERGVPIGKALAESMGVAESSIKDMISKGQIGFKDFEKAFKSLSSEGGLFAGAMDKQSKTIAGSFSTLKDNISLALGQIGKAISEAVDLPNLMQKISEKIQVARKWFISLDESTKKIILVIVGVVAAIGPFLVALGYIISMAPMVGAAITFMTGPVGIIVTAIGIAAGLIIAYWDEIYEFTVKIWNKIMSGVQWYIKLFLKDMKTFAELSDKYLGTDFLKSIEDVEAKMVGWAEESKMSLEKVEEKEKDLKKSVEDTTSVLDTQADAFDDVADSIEGASKEIEDFAKQFQNIPTKSDIVMGNLMSTFIGNESLRGSGQPLTDQQRDVEDVGFNFDAEAQAFAEAEEVKREEMKKTIMAQKGYRDAWLDTVDASLGLMKELGIKGRGLALLEIASNTARAISGAIAAGSTVPFPGNIAAIVTGVAAVVSNMKQAQAVMSSAPKLANGGIAFGNSFVNVGEYSNARTNPEVIAPLDKLKSMIGGGMGGNLQIQPAVLPSGDLLFAIRQAERNEMYNG